MQLRHIISCLAVAAALSARADVLDDIKPGEWFEAPNSKLVSVKPSPVPVGNTGITSVTDAWSGGSYDIKRDRLIVWGGGHGDYSGNEIYAFDIKTLKWLRASEPAVNVGGDEKSGIYPDGSPRSRHTYNYIQYVSAIDRFCTFGGAAMYPTGATGSTKTLCFDFDKKKWSYLSDAPGVGIGSVSGRDPAGNIWVQVGGSNGAFVQWDPVKNVWTKHQTYFKGWFDYYFTAAIGQNKFLALGEKKLLQWDLGSPKVTNVELATTGNNEIQSANNPGFVFDRKLSYFVAWNGGTAVYAFDLPSKKWAKVAAAASNKVTPTNPPGAGTYGRFQYIPSKDLFILVNRTGDDVFFYRMPAKLSLPPGAINPNQSPLNGKLEINILDGASSRSFSQVISLRTGLRDRGNLSCKIFSLQSEILYAQPFATGSSGPLVINVDASGGRFSNPASGAYFLQILNGDHDVVLSERLGLLK